MPQVRATISIEADLLKRIDDLAKRLNETRSELVATMCKEVLDGAERAASVVEDPAVVAAWRKALMDPAVTRAVGQVLMAELNSDQLGLFEPFANLVPRGSLPPHLKPIDKKRKKGQKSHAQS